ncbi:MAG: putative oxidoreductase [Saprospiraceae bacterium]|jgi:putative oxidoreductase
MPFLSLTQIVGRCLLASVFLIAGINKLTGFTGTQDYMESVGISGLILPLVIFVEIICSLMIIIDWKTPLAASILAIFSLITAFVFHIDLGNQMQQFMFFKNIAICGGLLILIASNDSSE